VIISIYDYTDTTNMTHSKLVSVIVLLKPKGMVYIPHEYRTGFAPSGKTAFHPGIALRLESIMLANYPTYQPFSSNIQAVIVPEIINEDRVSRNRTVRQIHSSVP
jgi:hypothetical protein